MTDDQLAALLRPHVARIVAAAKAKTSTFAADSADGRRLAFYAASGFTPDDAPHVGRYFAADDEGCFGGDLHRYFGCSVKEFADRSHLVQKLITDKLGRKRRVWVNPDKDKPAEKPTATEEKPQEPAEQSPADKPAPEEKEPAQKAVDVADVYGRAGTAAAVSEINAAMRAVGAMSPADLKALAGRMGLAPNTPNLRMSLAARINDRFNAYLRRFMTEPERLWGAEKKAEYAALQKRQDEPLLDPQAAVAQGQAEPAPEQGASEPKPKAQPKPKQPKGPTKAEAEPAPEQGASEPKPKAQPKPKQPKGPTKAEQAKQAAAQKADHQAKVRAALGKLGKGEAVTADEVTHVAAHLDTLKQDEIKQALAALKQKVGGTKVQQAERLIAAVRVRQSTPKAHVEPAKAAPAAQASAADKPAPHRAARAFLDSIGVDHSGVSDEDVVSRLRAAFAPQAQAPAKGKAQPRPKDAATELSPGHKTIQDEAAGYMAAVEKDPYAVTGEQVNDLAQRLRKLPKNVVQQIARNTTGGAGKNKDDAIIRIRLKIVSGRQNLEGQKV